MRRALLIGVAALAAVCLACYIATPNFLEAQSRKSSSWQIAMPMTAVAHADTEVLPPPQEAFNTEHYRNFTDNPFLAAANNPLSTFSIDVDTASYSNIRRFLDQGRMPPKDAVRIEELINYFPYDYAEPAAGDAPLAVTADIAGCPWEPTHRLARIALKGRSIPWEARPPANLVFLIDVSGSMQPSNKLPLVKKSLRMLVEQLREDDRVALAVYAGSSGLVLPSTSCEERQRILNAIENLEAGGSTNGGEGIRLAYGTARSNFIEKGVNRVILATDGDFNVGVTGVGELLEIMRKEAQGGIALTILGFGMGNYKDGALEQLADSGDGNYAYIDGDHEARKVLVEQVGGTMVTLARDVKLQIEFNPARVQAYRLIGYENRVLRAEDFNDDRKDAGEVGAGHCVTALYQIVPPGVPIELPSVDPLKYGRSATGSGSSSDEWFSVKLRYKLPDEEASRLISINAREYGTEMAAAPADFQFTAAVAGFGMLLRDSPHKGAMSFAEVRQLGSHSIGADPNGYRREFLKLVDDARRLSDK